jgi:SNF2 family DNA or RNA helicase
MTSPILSISLDKGILKTSLIFNGAEDSFSKVKLLISLIPEAVNTGQGFDLPWHSFKKKIVSIARLLKMEGIDINFDDYSKSMIDEWLSDQNYFRNNLEFLNVSGNEIAKLLEGSGFSRKLTPEQIRDTQKLLALKHGANFSVPGAGKTTTLLAVHSILKNKKLVNCLFVVAPINAFISWEDEIKEIFKKKRITVARLKSEDLINFHVIVDQKPDVILVNYEKMRKNIQGLYSYFSTNKIHLVLDESHRIKGGVSNLSFQQIINLADLAKRRDILSGTPMPQSIMDLDSQFDYLWSENVVENTLDKNGDDEQLKDISQTIKNYFVRTTKNELGLRPPIIKYRQVEMGPIQSELYKLFRSEAARLLAGLDKNSKEYFRSVGKSVVGLLQAAVNPMLLGTVDEYFQETLPFPENAEVWSLLSEYSHYEKSAKIEYLVKRVETILNKESANKIVVWSYFVRNIKLLERIFSDYNPVSIFGAIPSGDDNDTNSREWRIRKFHEDKTCRLMIANPQAGGEGISLHRVCHFAIYLDRNFNAAHYLQSVDRIHRLGLPKNAATSVELIVAKDTVDEIVLNRLSLKTKLMAKVLNDSGLMTLAYDPDDIEDKGLGLDEEDIKLVEQHILNPYG